MATYQVSLPDTGDSFRCPAGRSLLEAMLAQGRAAIPVGCRGGGCGLCKIAVLSGTYTQRVMSRAHVSVEDEQAQRVLACRISPTSDLAVRVLRRPPAARLVTVPQEGGR